MPNNIRAIARKCSAYLLFSPIFCIPMLADNVVHPSPPVLDRSTLISLGLVLPVTGDDNFNAQVAVWYRVTGTTPWYTAQPLFRVHPETVTGFSVTPQFAGSIFNLRPSTSYDIRLHLTDPDGPVNQIYHLTAQTRAVPTDPVSPVYVNVSNPTALANALRSATPGTVITVASGTYSGTIYFFASGTAQDPIVIRGESVSGTIFDGANCASCNVWEIYGNYVHLENLTVQNAQRAIRFQTQGAIGNVVRGVTILNTIMGIGAQPNQLDSYICDNTLRGRLSWPLVYSDDNGLHASDDGINVQGFGHVVCHNQISGYGDAMKTEQNGARAVDFYGNDILFTYDNGIELDGSQGNSRAFRNRFTNAWDTLSVQPIYGGPAYLFQNVVVNSADEQMKFHSLATNPVQSPSGVLAYHNTFVSTQGDLNLNTPNPSYYFTIENNLFLGVASPDWKAVSWMGPISHGWFDYDGYYPDGPMTFNFLDTGYDNWPDFAAVQSSSLEEPHGQILNGMPFATPILLPASWTTQMHPQNVALAPGSSPIDRGLVLNNINDGYTGRAPDLGAQEFDCPEPLYGPRPPSINESNEPFGCVFTGTPITITIATERSQIYAGQTNQFAATVSGTGNQTVHWTLSPALGSITGTGLYTAPKLVTAETTITATATSVADPSKTNLAFVTLLPN